MGEPNDNDPVELLPGDMTHDPVVVLDRTLALWPGGAPRAVARRCVVAERLLRAIQAALEDDSMPSIIGIRSILHGTHFAPNDGSRHGSA